MAHVLILGTTESGKTTCGKRLAHKWAASQVNVLVLDPLNDPGWIPDTQNDESLYKVFQTSDPEQFLAVFWESRRCAVFIDEAGEAVGKYNVVMQETATRGRHWGHSVHFLTQRGTQVALTVRDQCTRLFLFRSGPKDCKTHAEEWGQEELLNAVHLPKGCYYYVTRFGEIKRGSLFGSEHGTDTDSRNGGRDIRREEDPPAAPQTEAGNAAAGSTHGPSHGPSHGSPDGPLDGGGPASGSA